MWPLKYQWYEDYRLNEEKLDIRKAVQGLEIPVLICHRSNDEAVPVEAALELYRLLSSTQLLVLDTDHVFGRKHPWTSNTFPIEMQQVVEKP